MSLTFSDKTHAKIAGYSLVFAHVMLIDLLPVSAPIVYLVDVVSGCAFILLGVTLYAYFKGHKIKSSLYLALKILEGLLMFILGFVYMFPQWQKYREILYFEVYVDIFIISSALLYILIWRTRLLPRFISIWGFIGLLVLITDKVAMWMSHDITELHYAIAILLANEVFMGIWLIVKGFNEEAKLAME